MNEDERGFSPWLNHAAVGGPLDVTLGRERLVRFFSAGAAGAGFGAIAGLAAAMAFFATVFALATTRAAGFGGFTGACFRFNAAEALEVSFFATALTFRATGRATFFPAAFFTPAARFFPCTLAIPPLRGCEMDGAV
jgi:hypothetical protein